MSVWPDELNKFAFVHNFNDRLADLAALAESETWSYIQTQSPHPLPILYNYVRYTYVRLAEEEKIELSKDGSRATFNTGLVTKNQEPIYAYFVRNEIPNQQPWFLQSWRRRGEHEMTEFSVLPDMAHYFDDPSKLVYDVRKELRSNIEHIIADNKDRFPPPFNAADDYLVQTLLKGALENAQSRVRRNYKTAIPQYYKGRVQLLLPLSLADASKADLALVVEDFGGFYRASTCLTLDMAYNNARQLAKPDRDWLTP